MPGIWPSLKGVSPEIILAGGAVLLLVWDLFFRRTAKFCVMYGIAVALAALYVVVGTISGPGGAVFSGQFSTDGITLAARLLTLGVLIIVFLISGPYLAVKPVAYPEYVALFLFASAGLEGVAASRHWIVLFIFLEISTISIAALLGLRRNSRANREATLKYFVLSVFASAFLLYGIAMLFLTTGTFTIGLPINPGAYGRLALFLIMAGLFFKCALVPFHMWAPDVYEGGPTPVVAFLASASKATGFFVLARVLFESGAVEGSFVRPALWVISALSMVVGTLLALTQHNVKRMLAYSGVAHAGYVLMAFVAAGPQAFSVVLTYVMIYAVMSVGAFSVLATVEAAGSSPDRQGLTGLGRRSPALAFALAVFMVSLAGLPPAAGFIAKFVLFREVLAAGQLALVLIAVAMSVVSVGFYLRLLVPVFMSGDDGAVGERDSRLRVAPEGVVVAVFLAVAILVLGFLPQIVLSFAALISS